MSPSRSFVNKKLDPFRIRAEACAGAPRRRAAGAGCPWGRTVPRDGSGDPHPLPGGRLEGRLVGHAARAAGLKVVPRAALEVLQGPAAGDEEDLQGSAAAPGRGAPAYRRARPAFGRDRAAVARQSGFAGEAADARLMTGWAAVAGPAPGILCRFPWPRLPASSAATASSRAVALASRSCTCEAAKRTHSLSALTRESRGLRPPAPRRARPRPGSGACPCRGPARGRRRGRAAPRTRAATGHRPVRRPDSSPGVWPAASSPGR